MNDWSKYIVVANGDGVEEMVIFHSSMAHGVMARALVGVDAPNLVSAGQLRLYPANHVMQGEKTVVQCFGESVTLGLSARPNEDRDAAIRTLGLHPDDVFDNGKSRG